MPLRVGDRLGAYEIVALLGAGGMGETYRAVDTNLGRSVALKVLPDSVAHDPTRRARLKQEAAILATLNHPNIAAVYGWEDTTGRPALVLELVEGQVLRDLIHRGGIDLSLALKYSIQIARGLEAAHRLGIVHRDLNPNNVIVTPEGVVKLLDFGLAKLVQASKDPGSIETVTRGLTVEGMIVGTVPYMSPEQAQGKPLDTRSDLFSFGIMFYEMLTGSRPFSGGDNVSTLAAILKEQPKPVSQGERAIPREVDRVLMRCLRKDPERRFQTASDLRVALEDLLEELSSGQLESLPPAPRSRKRVWLAVSAVAVVTAAIAAAVSWIALHPTVGKSELKQLTFEPGMALMPAVSPDGKLLAYVSDRAGDGHPDLWLKQIAGGDALRKTSGQGPVSRPQFSADGTLIYYLAGRSIYTIPALGGSPRKVIDDAGPFSVSPRGEIAYIPFNTGGAGGVVSILTADASTSERWQQQCFASTAPTWSPDGEQILIVGSCGTKNPFANLGLYVGPRHGGSAQRLKSPSKGSVQTDFMALQRVSWFRVRNGSDGLILSLRSGDSQNLFRMSLNGATEPLTQGTGREAWPTVTASGDVVFERTEAAPTIWSLRPEGGDSERPRRETAPGLTFSVSRDGSKLVFGRLIGGGLGQFVLLDRTSGVETVLATHELGNGGVGSFWAQLSPDGSQAVYRVFGPQTGQFLVSTTGGGPRLVAKLDSGFGLPSDWSVDGKRILGECLRTTEGIWELDPSTGAAHKFAKDPKAELLYPSWSWDEKWMTFMRRSAGKTEIWVAPVRGEGLAGEIEWIRISPQDATGARSRFAPDGASVFYLLDENGNRSLVRQLLSPQKRPMGPPQKLAPIPINAGLTTNSTIGVSEDRVFFNTVEIRGNIWLKSIH